MHWWLPLLLSWVTENDTLASPRALVSVCLELGLFRHHEISSLHLGDGEREVGFNCVGSMWYEGSENDGVGCYLVVPGVDEVN